MEVFHLCRNLHAHDVLFAECIRTFGSMAIRMYNFPYGFMFPTMKQNLMQLILSTVFVIYESVLLLTPRVTCQGEYYSGLYVWMW